MTDPTDLRTRCVLGGPDKPHGAHVGHLCDGHLQRLSTQLRRIEDDTAHLELARHPSQAWGGTRSSGLASQRPALDMTTLALVGPTAPGPVADPAGWDDTPHVLGTLESWARIVREDRGLTPPDGPATVSGERATLTRHLDWIAAQDWVDDFAAEVLTLSAVLQAHVRTTPVSVAGRCWLGDPGQADGLCGGRVRRQTIHRTVVTTSGTTTMPVDDGPWHCARCGHTWDLDEHHATLILDQQATEARRPRTDDGRPMRTARELAQAAGLTLRAAQLRLSRSGIRPVMAAGIGHYPPDTLTPCRDIDRAV